MDGAVAAAGCQDFHFRTRRQPSEGVHMVLLRTVVMAIYTQTQKNSTIENFIGFNTVLKLIEA